jgi:dTDP-4-amino-4,6-dideoxygalactose transaminase
MSSDVVPFLDLVSQHRELEEELVAASRSIIRSAGFIGGPEVEGLEREFAAFCGAGYAVAVANGTDAVRFALMAAGVGEGDAVLTVAHTFIATVEAISQAGAATEFVDIDEKTYNMSPARLEEYLEACHRDPQTGRPLGQRTGKPIKAIVPVHLYGQPVDFDAIAEIAERFKLDVIEDACQAHGAECLIRRNDRPGWQRAGSLGRVAAFSFYPGKNLGACGEAGAITTNDEAIAKYVRMLRDHGQSQKYYHRIEGYNGRLDAMQAAFLRIKLRRLDQWNSLRREAAARYHALLAPLAENGTIALPWQPEWTRPVHHLYVIRAPQRDVVAKALNASGVQTGFHYPVPLHQQECYRGWGYKKGSLPVTERVAAEILSLPMYPGLTAEQQDRVASELTRALASLEVGVSR